ncbi:efflux RND transporter periplasmic adaptor subunit [bacterium]|nr:efflux RND transporter periplasmic adaptor subunit [bacterium]
MKSAIPFRALAFCLLLASCGGRGPEDPTGSGILEATEILLSARTLGTVEETAVQEGDSVETGRLLARIETEKLELQKSQAAAGLRELAFLLQNATHAADLAAADLENARRRFKRVKALYDSGSVTQQQFEDGETALKASETRYVTAVNSLEALRARREQVSLQMDLADSQIMDSSIRSPINGVVTRKYLEKGETARPGMPVVSVADMSRMWIQVYFHSRDIGRIGLMDPAALHADAFPDRVFPGKVTWISQRAEFTPKMVQTREARADLVYAVKVEVENPEGLLKIGMPSDVSISISQP